MRGKRSHKGKIRSFTAPEEIDRQAGRTGDNCEVDEPDTSASRSLAAESSEGEESRHKGISHLIEVCNPNVEGASAREGPSRKEAELLAKATAGPLSSKSEVELANDLARLALIRKEREQAALKREQERQAREASREAAAQRAQAKVQALRNQKRKPGQKTAGSSNKLRPVVPGTEAEVKTPITLPESA